MLVNGKVITTKRNYATCILDFIRFCRENDEPPCIDESLNAWAVMYWMQKRVWTLGSSNSHKTWSAALTWLCQCYGLPSRPPRHQLHPDFSMWFENVKKSAHRKTAVKTPMHAHCIWRYIRDCLGIVPGKLHLASYDNLLEAFNLAATFLTISRCTELLWSDKSDLEGIRTIITGLRWSDISIQERDGFRSKEVLDIIVRWFKNQEDRRIPKRIRMASPCCGGSTAKCICSYFDLTAYLKQIMSFRLNRHKNVRPFKKKGSLSTNALKNLATGPDDFVFVNSRGTILGYNYLYTLIKKVVAFNKIDTSKHKITPHSLRIGATSLAHHQCIDPLKIMRYVEWKPSACPTMHAHYVRYSERQLSVVPYEMLHGSLQFGEPTRNFIRSLPEVFEMRNEVIREALYHGGASNKTSKGLKSRIIPSTRAILHDPLTDG